ncbi:MAG: bifunctional 4-hydroxy-2-oxoglutarate aldolase/2-dehydro-3-deoxy-phosphogluconate aldolase [Candidatus Limnocylindrales bacterium]
MSRPSVPTGLTSGGVVAIARRLTPSEVASMADALLAGGIGAFELTLNDPEDVSLAAIESAATYAAGAGGSMAIGAGTVLTMDAARRAVDAGASFLVAPHLDPEVVAWAAERGIPMLPGAGTATEVLSAWRAGAAAVKVFPASAVGPSFLRELRGPFPDIPLQPTGGITVENAGDYIRVGAIAVGMGSWLFAERTPSSVTERARQATAAVAAARATG